MKMFRILNWVMAGMFFLCVIVQYNDPDPLGWIAIYGGAMISCLLFVRNRHYPIFSMTIGAIALIWAGVLFFGLQEAPDPVVWADVFGHAEMKTESVELTREIGGLLIVAVWVGIQVFFRKPQEV
ncbi:MAG: transmembrane 220 family protein [SAR324 cluster bacterium]|nr:transmembrane 220 family protein [SAR324 cluster bacterium]